MADPAPQSSNHGKVLMEWTFPEFPPVVRSARWYAIAGTIGAAAFIYALFQRNVLFAIILILLAIVYVTIGQRKPRAIPLQLTEDGVQIDNDFYTWKEFTQFWIIYQPPVVKKLFFRFEAPFRPTLQVFLEKENPVKVRQILLQYLKEDLNGEEPAAEQIGRALKL